MNKKSIPSIEEIIALLSHSSLPTVIIEGVDDVVVYRKLEDIFSESGLSVMPVHGRKNVLKIYDRLAEIPGGNKLTFIADRDLWVISGVPEEYISDRVIYTEGYSVENDIFKDSEVQDIMDSSELGRFHNELERFVRWYALAVNRTLNNDADAVLSTFPGRVLDDNGVFQHQTALTEGESYPADIHALITSDPIKYVRGKSLMQIATRQLMRNGRDIKIDPNMFLGVAPSRPGPRLSAIFSKVGVAMGA